MGVPPIAWIVLAMIWFGGSDATVRAVILISALPVVFLWCRSRHQPPATGGSTGWPKPFGAGPVRRFLTVGIRQTTTTLFPAFALALGTAFKVAVMAELLANAGGIGGALARCADQPRHRAGAGLGHGLGSRC